jgi:SAM-dependent methyltransferase
MELKPQSSPANGPLWGARARDWADLMEARMTPVYEAVLARSGVGSGAHLLDVGCGAGTTAQVAAASGVRASGIDAAEAMIAVARERHPQSDFHVGDMEALPFADATFDVVTGFNAFQYAANPVVALAEAARVTRAGGLVAITTWGTPEGMPAAAMVAALRPLLPPPPPGAPGPFALSDETALRAFATEAGLTPIEVFDVDVLWDYPDEATAVRSFNSAGVSKRAMDHTSEAAVTEAQQKALAQFRDPDGHYRLDATFRCLLART